MPFDLSVNNECQILEYKAKASIYKGLYENRKSGWVRLTGLPVGIACALMTVAKRVGLIVESILKGLINMFGGILCVPKCDFGRGLNQLVGGTISNAVYLPFSVVSAGYDLVRTTFAILVSPKEYTKEKWLEHDTAEQERREQAVAARKAEADAEARRRQEAAEAEAQKQRDADFAKDAQILQARKKAVDENNFIETADYISEAKSVAKMYWKGKGCRADINAAAAYYHKAAEKGDVESMVWLAKAYLQNSPEESVKFASIAAEKGSKAAQALLDGPLMLTQLQMAVDSKYNVAIIQSNALRAYIKNDFVTALNNCRDAIAKSPDSTERLELSFGMLAAILTNYPEYKQTEDEVENALAKLKDRSHYERMKAQIEYTKSRTTAAV